MSWETCQNSGKAIVKTFASIDEAVAVLGNAIDLESLKPFPITLKDLLDRRLLWLETVNLSYNGRVIGIGGFAEDFPPREIDGDQTLIAELSRSGIEYLSPFGPAYQDSNNNLYVFPQGKNPMKLSTLVYLEGDKNDFQSIASDILHPEMSDVPQARELILRALPLVKIIPYVPQPNQSLAFHYRAITSLLR